MPEYKFKVGDIVRIKDNYPVGNLSLVRYQGVHGQTGKITGLPPNYYKVDLEGFTDRHFREEELELVEPAEPEPVYIIETGYGQAHVHKAKPSASPVIGLDTHIGSFKTLRLAEEYVKLLKEKANA